MRSTFASKYNEVSAEKKVLEDQLSLLAGKFILRLTQPLSDPRLRILYPTYELTEPCFSAERDRMQEEHDAAVAKLNSSHDAEVAKLKAAQEAEVAKLVACHEEELEKRAAEVLEAKTYAQKVHRAHQFAKRDYERAKTSSALQAERMKEMEAEEKEWIKFLKEMDERLSRKFFLRLLSQPVFLRFTSKISSIDSLSQELAPPPMLGPPKLSKHFGRTELKKAQRNPKERTLGGGSRIGSTQFEPELPR